MGIHHAASNVGSILGISARCVRAKGARRAFRGACGRRFLSERAAEEPTNESLKAGDPLKNAVFEQRNDALARFIHPFEPDPAALSAEGRLVVADADAATNLVGVAAQTSTQGSGRFAGSPQASVNRLMKPGANGRDAHGPSMP